MSAAIQKTTADTLAELLRAKKDAIAQLVPSHLTPERLMRVAVMCVQKTPGLAQCTPSSLLRCVLTAAELGLQPGGAMGHFYLVPFGTEATPIIGYRGFVELAHRSGQVSTVRAVVVRKGDKFRVTEGTKPEIHHEPNLETEGDFLGVYAVATLKDGGTQAEYLSKKQVDAIRARSRSGKSGPWVTDYEEMAKKTAFRRLAKWLPLSDERLSAAMEVDSEDYVDGEATPVNVVTEALAAKVKQKAEETAPPVNEPTDEEIAAERAAREKAAQK